METNMENESEEEENGEEVVFHFDFDAQEFTKERFAGRFRHGVRWEEYEASRTREIFNVLKKLEWGQDICDIEEKNSLYQDVVQELQDLLDIKPKAIRERVYDIFLKQVNNLGLSEHVIKNLKDVAIYGFILDSQTSVVIEEESMRDEDVKKIKIRVKECCQKYLDSLDKSKQRNVSGQFRFIEEQYSDYPLEEVFERVANNQGKEEKHAERFEVPVKEGFLGRFLKKCCLRC